MNKMMAPSTIALDNSIGVVILGGQENALAVTRSLGRLGVPIAVIGKPVTLALKSRFCREAFCTEFDESLEHAFSRVLLTQRKSLLKGRVIFPCCDEAIKFLAENEDELRSNYILEEASGQQRLAMLDKMKTLELARGAGVATPKLWRVDANLSIDSLADELTFPIMVKPIYSHEFTKVFGCKLFIIEQDVEELKEKCSLVREHDIDVMIVEMIPGPDTLLSSFNTYIDNDGRRLYEFTKKIIRRYPENRGAACCHETEWLPQTRDAGGKFFDGIGFRGIGNIEFKKDLRDGLLKVIEVNARFTAAQVHANRAGAHLDVIAYAYLTNQPVPHFEAYKEGLRYWYPFRDFKAFRELHRTGRLTMWRWITDIIGRPTVNPYFAWDDLAPVFHAIAAFFRKRIKD